MTSALRERQVAGYSLHGLYRASPVLGTERIRICPENSSVMGNNETVH